MSDQIFFDIIKLFNKNELNYWVCHGTLLGLIRSRKLIPWDNDIDIGILYDKKKKLLIKKLMIKNGFRVKKKFFTNDNLLTFCKGKSKDIDINFYKITKDKKMVYVQWYIPKNYFLKLIDYFSENNFFFLKFLLSVSKNNRIKLFFKNLKYLLIKKNCFYRAIGYVHPYYFIQKKKKLIFPQTKILIPFYYKEYLSYIYGKNWTVPLKSYNWWKDSKATKFL
jgi:phosphorylcholine metabolism protein LicD